MTRAPATLRKADLRRAVEAVTAAGQIVARVEVDPNGKIVIVTAGELERREENSWDRACSFLDTCMVSSIDTESRGSISAAPGSILWPSLVSPTRQRS